MDKSSNSILTGNTIENNQYGISAGTLGNSTLTGNTVENNANGIRLSSTCSSNRIFHNNFINNENQASDAGSNYWDNGYPAGGNHWSDHTTPDNYSGPNQDIPGSDGIVDNRYDILGGANQDWYPLVNPYVEYCGVDVTIENALLEGYGSQVLEYTIDVHNTGDIVDNFSLSYIPDGWDNINIVPQVLTDVQPDEHRQAKLYVQVPDNAIECTYKEITVVAESQFCGATDNDSAQVHVIEPICGVDVTIVENLLEGPSSTYLVYTIDVHNSGNVVDNINLSYIQDGWPDITINPSSFTDVQPCKHRQATMSVHVPDGAEPCTYKEITVVAESQFCGAQDNDSAQVHVVEVPWEGTATISLKEIWTVNVDKDLKIYLGSKLVVKFYTYNDAYEGENVIETFVPPFEVKEIETARHPVKDTGVKKARLWLVDGAGAEIDNIATFTATRSILMSRLAEIDLEWPYADAPRRSELMKEIAAIDLQWPYAPFE